MKEIPLTQGMIARVDDWRYAELNKYRWYACFENGTWYALRHETINGKQKTIRMHQQVTGFQYKMIDHIDHDGLNNKEYNLRPCNHSQNRKNARTKKNNTSGLNGVTWDENKQKWKAFIHIKNKSMSIGHFDNKFDAGHAVDQKAVELFGEFAVLNFPEDKNKSWSYSPSMNKHRMNKKNTSGFRGVTWNKSTRKWQSSIAKDKKRIYLGIFDNKEKAGRIYDKKAIELFGEFAVLNFPDDVEVKK